ncbi:MAG: AmmeMemoRadiSam system protein A [bacterium]|nr:AmmeMemoRadiSam system protein A [bacterium]
MDEVASNQLLAYVRKVIEAKLSGSDSPVKPANLPDRPHGGGFVTLKCGGRLRGCMGTFSPLETVADTVRSAACSAAEDPRFCSHPVTHSELGRIIIEVSILGVPVATERPGDLEVGRHGIWIRRGASSGCFLPQVATERGWSAEEFLSNCCTMKAGLSADSWQDPATEVLLFGAEIIADSD